LRRSAGGIFYLTALLRHYSSYKASEGNREYIRVSPEHTPAVTDPRVAPLRLGVHPPIVAILIVHVVQCIIGQMILEEPPVCILLRQEFEHEPVYVAWDSAEQVTQQALPISGTHHH